jgi:hypothetical protein
VGQRVLELVVEQKFVGVEHRVFVGLAEVGVEQHVVVCLVVVDYCKFVLV